MDPEFMRLAQEQMSRMSPADLAQMQQQMMSNPELLRMASEGMQNMRPEDLRNAAEQLKHTRPEDLAELRQKMANVSPEEIASMRAGLDAQTTYKINAAQMLKKQGNELHSQERYKEASQKYLLAKNNLKEISAAKGRSLLCICSLNLMSSYLKTGQYDECVTEGTEVLSYDNTNVKALYRRGQAYKALGWLENAVSDLTKAHENSPDDETIADVLRDAKEKLTKEGGRQDSKGLTVEEITEEEPGVSSGSHESSREPSLPKLQESTVQSPSHPNFNFDASPSTSAEYMQTLNDDPESIRTFQDFISRTDPETLASLNNGKADGISPDMVKTASNVIGKMSPEELQRMMKLASSFQGNNPFSNTQSAANSNGPTPTSSIPSNVTPDMLKMASDMMSKMSPEDLQRMLQMSSGLKGADFVSTSAVAKPTRTVQESVGITDNDASASSGSRGLSCSNVFPPPPSNLAAGSSGGDMQEQMRNQMKDPAMRQMFSSMMKNISPEMMANMSEQFGMKLSSEDAAKAQQAMSSMSPEDLDRMMKWADRIQRGVEGAKKTKNWLLGKPGMVLALLILLFAVFLNWLGYIGR